MIVYVDTARINVAFEKTSDVAYDWLKEIRTWVLLMLVFIKSGETPWKLDLGAKVASLQLLWMRSFCRVLGPYWTATAKDINILCPARKNYKICLSFTICHFPLQTTIQLNRFGTIWRGNLRDPHLNICKWCFLSSHKDWRY